MKNRALSLLAATLWALAVTSPVSAQVIVSDWGGRLTSYNVAGGTSSVINGMQNQPTGMAYGPDGLLYVSDIGSNTVNRYHPITGQYLSTAITSAQLGAGFQATGLAFLPGGDLLVANQVGILGPPLGSGSVWRFNFMTSMLTQLPLPGLNQPEGLLYHNGFLYIAEVSNIDPTQARISRYDFVNPLTTFVANGPSLNQPIGLAVGPDDQLYATDATGFSVRKFDFNNASITSTFASGAGFNSPTGVAFFNGFMYVSNYGTGAADGFLSRFNWTTGAFDSIVVPNLIIGSAVTIVPEPGALALLSLPAGLFVLRRLGRLCRNQASASRADGADQAGNRCLIEVEDR